LKPARRSGRFARIRSDGIVKRDTQIVVCDLIQVAVLEMPKVNVRRICDAAKAYSPPGDRRGCLWPGTVSSTRALGLPLDAQVSESPRGLRCWHVNSVLQDAPAGEPAGTPVLV
jgi:hypothetical protein